MTHFLIQTVNGHVVHDFAFHLIKAIEYHNWLRNEEVYSYSLSETPEGSVRSVPIGSLEYVFAYMERYEEVKKEQIRPLNIPLALRSPSFTGREVYVAQKEEIPSPVTLFIKSNERYKGFTDMVENTDNLPSGEYMVSEVVDFDSEWRAFVQHGELIGLQHYLGNFLEFPDGSTIREMIKAYHDAPLSYTLDIGVQNQTTMVIEVHPFVSCGLYGFHDYKRLPSMFIQGYYYMRKEALFSE